MKDIEEIIGEGKENISFAKMMLAMDIKHKGNQLELFKAIKGKMALDDEEVEELIDGCELKGLGLKMVILGEEKYPQCLKNLVNPPIILFVSGDVSALDKMMAGKLGGNLVVASSWGSFKDVSKNPKEAGLDIIIGECPFLKADKNSNERASWLAGELLKAKNAVGHIKMIDEGDDDWKAA